MRKDQDESSTLFNYSSTRSFQAAKLGFLFVGHRVTQQPWQWNLTQIMVKRSQKNSRTRGSQKPVEGCEEVKRNRRKWWNWGFRDQEETWSCLSARNHCNWFLWAPDQAYRVFGGNFFHWILRWRKRKAWTGENMTSLPIQMLIYHCHI